MISSYVVIVYNLLPRPIPGLSMFHAGDETSHNNIIVAISNISCNNYLPVGI